MDSSVKDFFAGWVGGLAGLIIGHPADTIKVRQQFMNESFLTTVRTTYKYEGFLGFYKGVFAPFLTIGPSNAVFFCAYGNCIRYLQNSKTSDRIDFNNDKWVQNVVIAGCIAGFAQVIATCPVELIKTVLQTNTGEGGAAHWKLYYKAPYTNTTQAVQGIFHERGIPGFYRGLVPMMWRDVPTSGIYMYVYEALVPRGEKPALWQHISAGGIAGMAAWIFTVPFDVMKSRMQSDNPNNPLYSGMIDCFHKSLKADGVQIFVKGFWLILARAFPVNAAILVGFESVSVLLK